MQSTMTNNNITFNTLEIPTYTRIYTQWAYLHAYSTYAYPCASMHAKIQTGRWTDRQKDRQEDRDEKHFIQFHFFIIFVLLIMYVIFKQKLIFPFKYWISHINIFILSYQNLFLLAFGQHILQFEVQVFLLLQLWPFHPSLQFHQ